MESDFFAAILKAGGLTGTGGVIIAALYGLAALVRAWRDGSVKAVEGQKTTLEQQLALLEARLNEVESELDALRVDFQGNVVSKQTYRYQRDSARALAEGLAYKLGEALPAWPADPTPA